MRRVIQTRLVRFDIENEHPVRDAKGLCIECKPDEAGEAIGKIDEERGRFEGYSQGTDTEKKILRDVFEKGDAWFRTGDLLKRDTQGYYYFIDRIGDTFRWKGENVSTNEVAERLTAFPGITEAIVYGVTVGSADGRAGMAAISTADGFDLAALYAYLQRELPPFARPLFVRLHAMIETTGTFKYRKLDFVHDGFDPERLSDAIFFADPEAEAFVPMTAALRDRLNAGAIKL
jgi:fatty-acyl-CoA synthase